MATAPIPTVVWTIDPAHSRAAFSVKHMMISNVRGTFSGLDGVLIQEAADHSLSRIDASIEVGTVNTGDEQRDGHLKSGDFFDQTRYPRMTFKSTTVNKQGEEEYAVTGDLTLHGVTKAVTFTVEGPSLPIIDPSGKARIGLSAVTTINRKDFNLTWNAALESGGILVGENVSISLDVQFIKA